MPPRFERERVGKVIRQLRVCDQLLQNSLCSFRFKALKAVTKISAVASVTLILLILVAVAQRHKAEFKDGAVSIPAHAC